MVRMDAILKEIEKVPDDRLDDLFALIHSFQKQNETSENRSKQILSYSGAFKGMSKNEYEDFQRQIKETRNTLFIRDVTL
jgi:hypothetical protein